MIGVTHMLAGALAYRYSGAHRPAGLLLVFATHFLFNAVPHYELGLILAVPLGIATGIAILFAVRQAKDWYLFAASLFGILPDMVYVFNVRFFDFLHFYHYPYSVEDPLWLIPEALIVVICIVLLAKKLKWCQ